MCCCVTSSLLVCWVSTGGAGQRMTVTTLLALNNLWNLESHRKASFLSHKTGLNPNSYTLLFKRNLLFCYIKCPPPQITEVTPYKQTLLHVACSWDGLSTHRKWRQTSSVTGRGTFLDRCRWPSHKEILPPARPCHRLVTPSARGSGVRPQLRDLTSYRL